MSVCFVLVLDQNKKPLTPCKPGMARSLLKHGKAAVFRQFPFTIILKKSVAVVTAELTLKIDPGSKTTGMAVLDGNRVVFGLELTHRGGLIKNSLDARRVVRRNRRARNTRYRKARFLNRTRPQGWLAPGLKHRVLSTLTWVRRLIKFMPITKLAQELVRFDMQQIEDAKVSGVGYQQGELAGYEVREYLLEKWSRKCTYCSKENVPLQIEHILAKANQGTNKISNLCLACNSCNQKKGTKKIEVFLAKKPELLAEIKRQASKALKDAAAVNSTRWDLFSELKATGLPVTTGTGGQTKWNRTRFGLEKTHWLDAACVGQMNQISVLITRPLLVTCRGQGGRQKVRVNKSGYPICHRPLKPIHGWRTGDYAKFEKQLYAVTPRTSGYFMLTGSEKLIYRSMSKLSLVQKMDGYKYG